MTATLTPNACSPEVAAPSLRDQIRAFLAQAELHRTESWVQRVSRDFARKAPKGTPLQVFIATRIALTVEERRHVSGREDLRYLLSYSDPTGETAVRNVMREQR